MTRIQKGTIILTTTHIGYGHSNRPGPECPFLLVTGLGTRLRQARASVNKTDSQAHRDNMSGWLTWWLGTEDGIETEVMQGVYGKFRHLS